MPEQEMFENAEDFATFLTSSHSFLMGHFFPVCLKNLCHGKLRESEPGRTACFDILVVCVCSTVWDKLATEKRGRKNSKEAEL